MKRKFGLIQENYQQDEHAEWKMLVCCVLLNQTTRTQVDKIIDELFERWPGPREMSTAHPQELEDFIRPLGFYKRRSSDLMDGAGRYVKWKRFEKTPEARERGLEFDPRIMSGCGEYAFHSWMIFTKHVSTFEHWEEFFDECPVTDKHLLNYLKWRSRYDPRNKRRRDPRDL